MRYGAVMRSAAFAAALALLPLGLGPLAQPAPATAPLSDDADTLADMLLAKVGGAGFVHTMIVSSRPGVLQMLENAGPTEAQAEEIWGKYMVPEFDAQAPKLMARFHAILIEDFTVPELQAAIGDLHNAARQSGAAKVPHMQEQFQKAGAEWGSQVGIDAYDAHREEMAKLGVKDTVKP